MSKTSTQQVQIPEALNSESHHTIRPPSLRGRRLILIDIENISGGAIQSLAETRWAQKIITSTLGLRGQEQVVIGVSRAGAINTGPAWPSARLVTGSGVDGADHALLDVLNSENIAGRFDEVILVSGDGIFADTVATLGGQRVKVTVVAHPVSLAKRLQMAAAHSITFSPSQIAVGGAA